MLGVDRARNNEEKTKTAHGRGFLNRTLTREDLARAKDVLASFDLIVVPEQLSDIPDMARMFRSITGAKISDTLPRARKGQEREKYGNEPPSAHVLARLTEFNALDLELYEWAQEYTKQTVASWVAKNDKEVEEEEVGDALLNDECVMPPQALPQEAAKWALGGPTCAGVKKPFYYYGGRCLQHSLEGGA
jgi:hypothetical protein